MRGLRKGERFGLSSHWLLVSIVILLETWYSSFLFHLNSFTLSLRKKSMRRKSRRVICKPRLRHGDCCASIISWCRKLVTALPFKTFICALCICQSGNSGSWDQNVKKELKVQSYPHAKLLSGTPSSPGGVEEGNIFSLLYVTKLSSNSCSMTKTPIIKKRKRKRNYILGFLFLCIPFLPNR